MYIPIYGNIRKSQAAESFRRCSGILEGFTEINVREGKLDVNLCEVKGYDYDTAE